MLAMLFLEDFQDIFFPVANLPTSPTYHGVIYWEHSTFSRRDKKCQRVESSMPTVKEASLFTREKPLMPPTEWLTWELRGTPLLVCVCVFSKPGQSVSSHCVALVFSLSSLLCFSWTIIDCLAAAHSIDSVEIRRRTRNARNSYPLPTRHFSWRWYR